MKKPFYLILSILVLFSCSKKNGKEERTSGVWKELEVFHKVMADVYHPMKDSGNLAPARKSMNQLAEEADKWSASKLPDRIDTPNMKEKLGKLKTQSRILADEIAKGASDESVKEKLTQLHAEFHEIMEAWFGANKDNDKEEGNH